METKKSHAPRLKSAEYKTNVIKEQLLKWMNYNKMNQSHNLSYDETLFLCSFVLKLPKIGIACSYLKEGHLYPLKDSALM